MKSIKLYGLRNCDSCRKAVKALRAEGAEVMLHDIRAEPVSQPILLGWLETFGDELINRRSTTWRGLDHGQRGVPAADLLAAHPALMKRPLIETSGQCWLGWNDAVRAQVLDAARD